MKAKLTSRKFILNKRYSRFGRLPKENGKITLVIKYFIKVIINLI